MSRFSVKIFFSHIAEKRRRGNLQSFINFGYRKNLDKRGGGGREYHNFLSQSFCFTVRKKFVGEPFRVSLIRVSKYFMLRMVTSRFFVGIFCFEGPNIFVGDPFCAVFPKVSGSQKVYG